jgi:peptide/nickel transport system permease protein
MSFLPVLLWSDVLIWLLLLGAMVLGVLSARNPLLRAAWQRVGRSRAGMASATLLIAFVVVGLLDSLHYRRASKIPWGRRRRVAEQPRRLTRSRCCRCSTRFSAPLRTRHEKTYSEPLATRLHAKESIDIRAADGQLRAGRDYPRLKYGGAHLGADEARRAADIGERVLRALGLALLAWSVLAAATAARCGASPNLLAG